MFTVEMFVMLWSHVRLNHVERAGAWEFLEDCDL